MCIRDRSYVLSSLIDGRDTILDTNGCGNSRMQRRDVWCCQKGIDVCGVARACAYDVLKFYGILKSGAESLIEIWES